jgi:hypothetical protein
MCEKSIIVLIIHVDVKMLNLSDCADIMVVVREVSWPMQVGILSVLDHFSYSLITL